MKVLFILIFLSFLCCQYSYSQEKLYPNEFSLHDVTLLESPFKHARDLNIQTLLKYNVDRLLAPYRKEAGLTPKDSSYTNWEGLDGHIGWSLLVRIGNECSGNKQCRM